MANYLAYLDQRRQGRRAGIGRDPICYSNGLPKGLRGWQRDSSMKGCLTTQTPYTPATKRGRLTRTTGHITPGERRYAASGCGVFCRFGGDVLRPFEAVEPRRTRNIAINRSGLS
jgi:hypothetical protein